MYAIKNPMKHPGAWDKWLFPSAFLLPVVLVGGAWLSAKIWPPEWDSDRTLALEGQVEEDDDLFPATDQDFAPMGPASYKLRMQRNIKDPSYGYIVMTVPPHTLALKEPALARLSCRLVRRAVQYPTQTNMRRFFIEYRLDPDDGASRTIETTLDACRDQ
jgi:hypothetical protein